MTCARVLRPLLAKVPDGVRRELGSEDLPEAWAAHPRTLADWARILGSSKAMADYLGRTLRDGRWLAESLGPVLADFARYRNPAAHETVAGRADVIRWRGGTRCRARSCGRRKAASLGSQTPPAQRILGIGCEGVLAKLAGVGAARS